MSLDTEGYEQMAPRPYGDDLSTHALFQALKSEGYVILSQFPEIATALLQLPTGITVEDAMEDIRRRSSDVESVCPDYLVPLAAANRLVPSDTNFDEQWYFDNTYWPVDYDVDAPEGWWYESGNGPGKDAVIAVLDTGVARSSFDQEYGVTMVDHPDLSPRLTSYGARAYRLQSRSSINVGGGYPRPGEVDDYFTWPHGTAVASIIGAITNNWTEVGSMAGGIWSQRHKIFPVQMEMVLNTEEEEPYWEFPESAIVRGLYQVGQVDGIFPGSPVKYNITALNMSFGGPAPEAMRAEAWLLYYFLNRNMVCVAAGGNENSIEPQMPAAVNYYLFRDTRDDWVMGVGGTTWTGWMWSKSNYDIDRNGDGIIERYNVNVCAPSTNLFVAFMNSPTQPIFLYKFNGTSGAAPQAAALAGLFNISFPWSTYNFTYLWIVSRAKPGAPGDPKPNPGILSYYLALRRQ